jgi:hypothetical protein
MSLCVWFPDRGRVGQIFLGVIYQHGKIPKQITSNVQTDNKISQRTSKYTKRHQNAYTKWHQNANGIVHRQYYPFQGPPKYTKIVIFGKKTVPSGNPGIRHRLRGRDFSFWAICDFGMEKWGCARAAIWYIFQPKILRRIHFEGHRNGKCWYIFRPIWIF